jgi:hypothetical protein
MPALLNLIDLSRPDQAKLLQRRMTNLALDIGAWALYEPADFLDLESVCAACASRQTCANDLVEHIEDPTWPDWRDYCPNAAKLDMLVALQFYQERPRFIGQMVKAAAALVCSGSHVSADAGQQLKCR